MRFLLKLLSLSPLLLLAAPAAADETCPQHFLQETPPAATVPGGVLLCNRAYAVMWNPATRDPAYAAEHLTAQGLMHAKETPRGSGFRADERLPPETRTLLGNYKGQEKYDRGHMAPDHDMPDDEAAHESFLLSNIVPQDKANNRGPWAHIEETARDLVASVYQGEGWVVTGPAFDTTPALLHNRVAVPSRLWKAVYVPGNPQLHNETVVGAWVVDNASDAQVRFMSLDQLRGAVGVDPFPTLSPELHARAALPATARKRTHVE